MPTPENINSSIAESVNATVRERLLKAALTIFNAKGYAATSVREIVAAAGVTKPALYYYFKNKNGIYLELVCRAQELFQKVILQNIPSQETLRNQLKLFALRIFDSVIENKAVACFAITATFSPRLQCNGPDFTLAQYDAAVIEIIQNLVQQGMDRKEFQSVNVEHVSWLYASCITKAVLDQICLVPLHISREALARKLDVFLDVIACEPSDSSNASR
jgi:AcrR family transcriptional regulator